MAEKLKVLVVDDAAFMRRAVREILEQDSGIQVIDEAQNGLEAIRMIRTKHPDVVTLDMDMPVMDGLTAIRHIMIESPLPVIVLSSLVHDGSVIFEALRLGVVDFIPKPSGAISLNIQNEKQKIIDRVKMAQRVNLENLRRVRLPSLKNGKEKRGCAPQASRPEFLVALGTNISGPNTIIRLVSQLPSSPRTSIVVVQEIASRILPSFVDRFNQFVPCEVQPVKNNLKLEQGVCYISSNEWSLRLETDPDGSVRMKTGDWIPEPINLLFSSAAEIFGPKTIGVLLTGLGEDGAEGLGRIQQKQGMTIVEDTTCCVYPHLVDHAIRRGVANLVLRETRIPGVIESLLAEGPIAFPDSARAADIGGLHG
jgi:two-component system chemotaxis response regulator CheB